MAPKWVSDERYEIAELGVDNSYGGADSRIVCYNSALIILLVTVGCALHMYGISPDLHMACHKEKLHLM